MPETEVGRRDVQTTEWIEEGTTLVDDVWASLRAYDGGVTEVVVEIEYERVGGATPAAARCIGVVFAVFGSMPISVVAVRTIMFTNIWSQHAYGNAVDFMIMGEEHERLARFLNSQRGPLDIAHLLADPYYPSPLRNHFNHVHVDFYPQWGGTPPGHPI